MTIKTTVTNLVEVEVPVPFFARSVDEKYYIGLLDEKTVVRLTRIQNYTCIQNSDPDTFKTELADAWKNCTACTESEFISAYDNAIESISLHPKIAV